MSSNYYYFYIASKHEKIYNILIGKFGTYIGYIGHPLPPFVNFVINYLRQKKKKKIDFGTGMNMIFALDV